MNVRMGYNKTPFTLIFQGFALFFSALVVITFISSIASYYEILQSDCILQSCGPFGPPPFTRDVLLHYDLTPDLYALIIVLNDSGLIFIYYTAALIIVWKSKRDLIAFLAVVGLVSYGTTFPVLTYLTHEEQFWMERWIEGIAGVGRIALFCFLLLFPNGKFVSKWIYVAFIPFVILQFSNILMPDTMFDLFNWSGNARIVYYGIMIACIIYSLFYRYRKIFTPEQRQQTKWVVYGMTLSFLGFIVISGFIVIPDEHSPINFMYLSVLLHAFVAIIPITLSFAILRHRLWDIDPLVNRTIVYGALSLSIVLIYSLSVIYLGNLFRTEENFFISLLATSIVAILFSPLKDKLQRVVNRYMKGRHDDPYSVLVQLGNQLTKPISPDETLGVVIATIQDALRLPYVGISIGASGNEKLAASTGKIHYDRHSFPITHGGEELGTLLLSSRSPEETFTAEDRKLLDVLLRQAGPIVQNIKMVLDMGVMAQDLQFSREKLVLAREEERRQIRMNLHDELAPRLISLSFNVAAAEQYMRKSPEKAIEMMGELRGVIRSMVDEIRTMVHGLRPPTLDEFGLLGSIQSRINEITKTSEQAALTVNQAPLQVNLTTPDQLPDLPAAVEVAVYRIVTESLVNVVRHARATYCYVHIMVKADSELSIEVIDDGIGLPPSIKLTGHGGIGVASIRERAVELGGQCFFERLETGGTRVRAILPFTHREEII
ncbi:MAG: sensor histidine kinase [Paenibacillus sp.]|jgi:signal transduction histidine kinase|nr:sensor histidine kinase [Paenibacillus sp.]